MKTLILGGVRSGKSYFAQQLAEKTALPVTFIATATAGDAEMSARIDKHKKNRPKHWSLVEEPIELAQILSQNVDTQKCVIVDCLTLWLSNLLHAGDEVLRTQLDALQTYLPRLAGRILLISNEVGLGVIPMGALSREFCDHAGRLHQNLAQICEQVFLLVAGIPVPIKNTDQ